MNAEARNPTPLSGNGDMAHNWRMWREDFEVYLKVTGYDQQSKENQAYLLRNQIGMVGHEIIEKLMSKEQFNKNDVDVLLEKLEHHLNPHKSEVEERYNFFIRSRGPYESIEDYVSNLTAMSKSCNFGDMTDSLIRDKVITSIVDVNLRKKCFAMDNLDLSKLMSIYKQHQKIVMKNKKILNNRSWDNSGTHLMNVNGQMANNRQNRKPCWRCRQHHPVRNCPAWGHRCNNCNEMHHLAICCKISHTDNKEKEEYTTRKKNLTEGTTVDTISLLSPRPSLYPSAPPLSEVENIQLPSNTYSENKSSTVEQRNDYLSMMEKLQKAEVLKQRVTCQGQSPKPQKSNDECRIF